MPSRTLHLDIAATTQNGAKLEPVTRFRLFNFGQNDTSQGTITLTETGAKSVMAQYEKRTKARGMWLDIDWFHLSRKADARLEDRLSAGRCKLELVPGEGGGIDVVEITPTEKARQALESDEVRSYSPVVSVDSKGNLLSIEQLSLTNIPAMDDAGLLAAEDVLDDALLLSVTPFQRYPIYDGATWDGRAADQRVREFLSSDGSGDMDKVDMTRYRRAFVFFDGEAPEAISRYKGQILDVQDVGNGPELVIAKKAVQTLGAIMQGSRGGINVSDSDREKGKALLSRYYKLFDAVAPWDREEKPMADRMTPRVELQLEAAKWSNEMRDLLRKALAYRFGEYAYLDDYSADKIRVCVYKDEGMAPGRYFEMPYTITGEKVDLGDPVEVVMSYVPKAQAAEVMAMQDRLNTAHTRLLEVTGGKATGEALILLEALQRNAARAVELEAKLVSLEDREYAREREVMISNAKRAGKWTLALEQQADRLADMARRLGENRVKALETHWDAAPVVIAPGGEREADHKTLTLSESEETAAISVAKMQGKDLEVVRKSMLAAKSLR
jgi:phage I-like protein